jgi:hypothetical protein
VDRYEFGPTLVNKAVISYGSWNGSSCVSMVSNHINGKPCDVQGQDSSSNVFSHSRFNYNTSTGDLLTKYDYSAASTYLTTTYTYNTNGTMASVTKPNGIQTTFAYNGTGGCASLLPTSATSAIGTASTTWDCNGALPATTTDLNGLVVTNTYGDSLYRITQVSDNGGQAAVNFTYPSTTRSSRHMTFNSSNSIIDTTTTLNFLGQVQSVQSQTAPGNSNYDTVSFTYDATGHRTNVSQACTTTVGGTCGTNATADTFDGMNRLKTHTVLTSTNGVLTYTYPNGDVNISLTPAATGENSKIVQNEYDGLGRLVSSCAVWTTGGSGSGSCNQRSTGSGYLTKYTLDALGRATQIARNKQSGATEVDTSATYDMLGRVTQGTVPESGTSHLYYDSTGPDCSSFSTSYAGGKITETKDPAGNVVCLTRESSGGRVNNTYVASGPNSSSSHAKYFKYDTAFYGTGTNLVGRMSASGTCQTATSCAGSSVTIHGFGYDKYGRGTDDWQSSPSAAFHTTASFFDNGALNTLGGLPGVSSFTYGVDGEGREKSATNGTSFVSSVSYDAASRPLTISFGNGDSDTYQWDANSGNMTQYQFKIGSSNTTDTGVLTWNPNGTLGTLAITDNLTSVDSQTCNTGHDDLVRITSWNCGAHWSLTNSYSADYAGNVTKSGNISFNPGYVASNNHFASGSGCTYDSNGNILHDCSLSQDYTWDGYGSVATSAGSSLTNDASGVWIEKQGPTFRLISPIGSLELVQNTTTPYTMRIPLPGGATVTFDNASHTRLEHKDWMGSTRLVTDNGARTLVAVYAYGPEGELYNNTDSNGVFEGARGDTSVGLYDYLDATYSGTWGRSVQPTGGANGYVKTNSPF